MAAIWFIAISFIAISAAPITGQSAKKQVNRVRGIPLSRLALYDATKSEFTCLDGKKTIKFTAVNDDYCDCDDGSDEPDCCDGSDEWSGQISCPNTCDELGKETRERAQKLAEDIKQGHEVREQLQKEGEKTYEEAKTKLEQLQKELEELKPKHQELDDIKKDAEKRETEAKDAHRKAWEESKAVRSKERARIAFSTLDANSDEVLTVDEMQMRSDFDHDLDGTVSEQEAKDMLQGSESSDLENFVEKLWPSIKVYYKDEGLVTVSPDFQGESAAATAEPVQMTTPTPPTSGDPESEIEQEINEDDENDDEVEDFDSEKYMNEGKTGSVPTAQSIEDGESEPEYDEATRTILDEVNKARGDFNEIDRRFNDIQRDITTQSQIATSDWGKSHEWLALRSKCFELKDTQYTYKLCLFDRATQASLNGGGETNLGVWGEWQDDDHTTMKYKDGTGCWNGPNRSTVVTTICSVSTTLLSASEPARCEYAFELGTPLACDLTHIETLTGEGAEPHAEL